MKLRKIILVITIISFSSIVFAQKTANPQIEELKDNILSPKIKMDINTEYKRGEIALDLNDIQQSIKSFQFVIEHSKDSDIIASSYGNLGIAYMLNGNSTESIIMYDRACKMNSKQYCHIAAFNKGNIYENKGNYKKAIEAYKDCIALEPSSLMKKIITGYKNLNYQSNYNIASIYTKYYGNCNIAIKYYKESIKPFDEEALGEAEWKYSAINNIGYCYYELGDYKKCIVYFKMLLELNKYDKDALISICYAYDNLGNKTEARKYCQIASELGDIRGTEFLNQIKH